MTHFKTLVVLPATFTLASEKAVEAQVEHMLAPYDENEEWFREGSRWDWWIIGGRWDGEIQGLPWQDLKEVCRICKGTGERPGGLEEFGQAWHDGCNGCNGCGGSGKSSVWPSHQAYSTLKRNVATVSTIHGDYAFGSFVDPEGSWHEEARVGWFGTTIPDEDDKSTKVGAFDQAWARVRDEYPNNIAVSVDCHV